MARDGQRRNAVLKAISGTAWQALSCFTPPDVLLLTGYWPVMGSSLAMMTREGRVCCVVPEDEMDLARATSDAELIPYKPAVLDSMTATLEQLTKAAAPLFARLTGEIATGLEDETRPASYQASHHFRSSVKPLLQALCPGGSVVSADEVLGRLKSTLTSGELDGLRRACGLAGTGFAEAEGAIAAGRREDEVAAEIGAAFARVANAGFERGDGFFFCMSGPNSAKAAGAYARTRRRVLEEGDLVMIHANTVGDGLWTDITRTYTVGTPTGRQPEMRAAIDQARAAALKAIAPGAHARDVDAAARDVLARHGYKTEFKHATGHGVGYAAAAGTALPRIHPKSPDVLQAGMTFNIEPAIYFDGVEGMRHCDVVACTPSGAEVLTGF